MKRLLPWARLVLALSEKKSNEAACMRQHVCEPTDVSEHCNSMTVPTHALPASEHVRMQRCSKASAVSSVLMPRSSSPTAGCHSSCWMYGGGGEEGGGMRGGGGE